MSASALQKLTREAQAAERNWREARSRADAAQADLDRLQDLAGTLPLLGQCAALEERLDPLRHLPDAAPEVQERFARIETDKRDLTNRIRDRALRILTMEERRAALATDPDALAQAAAIEAVDALRPEHDTAVTDLPRRRAAADEAGTRIAALLAQMGQEGVAPSELCLPGTRLSTLRALLTERSGLTGTATTTALETAKAAALLEREQARLGDPGPAGDESALAALLARLRGQDPADALSRALRDRDQALSRLDSALIGLVPWTGDADALAALAVPPGWQIEEWASAQETARQQELDARREAEGLREELGRLQSDAAGRGAAHAASGVTLADAAGARSNREALWAVHLADLSTTSARSFEQALRQDDRISALLADTLAMARREALDQAAQDTAAARLEAAEGRLDAALVAQHATRSAIDATTAALGLAGVPFGELRRWLDLRIAALTERAALRDAETAVIRCRKVQQDANDVLRAALHMSTEHPPEGFESLLARATARIEASERRREARQRLQSLASDLRDRRQAEMDAVQALDEWRNSWTAASLDSPLASYADDDPGLGTVLDLLDQLGVAQQAFAGLTDRIDKMEANRHRFAEAKSAILNALNMDQVVSWADVLTRLRNARDAARDHETLARQIADEHRLDSEDRRMLEARGADATAIGAALGWTEADGSLAEHIAGCRDAAILRHGIDALRDQLRDRPAPAEGEDVETVRQRVADLKADLQILRSEVETCLAAHLEAKRRIEAVGGDDALARIVATRENVLLEIRERAEVHLASRFGLIAFETGLRRYRDQHRSAMLTRASEAFVRLSRGRIPASPRSRTARRRFWWRCRRGVARNWRSICPRAPGSSFTWPCVSRAIMNWPKAA